MSENDSEDDTVWILTPPLIENAMSVYTLVPEKNWAFTLTARMRFDLTCPVRGDNPPVEIIIRDKSGKGFISVLTSEKPITDEININPGLNPGLSYAGLYGAIRVDYNYRSLCFEAGSCLRLPVDQHTIQDFPLQGVVIFQWCGNDPPQRFPVAQFTECPPFLITKTMKVMNVYTPKTDSPSAPTQALTIKTEMAIDSSNPNSPVDLWVYDHTDKLIEGFPQKLRLGAPQTNPIQLKQGADYAGIKCSIGVDYETGCVYFDGFEDGRQNFREGVLIKPDQETHPGAGDYEIRYCRIFDWLGKPWPKAQKKGVVPTRLMRRGSPTPKKYSEKPAS